MGGGGLGGATAPPLFHHHTELSSARGLFSLLQVARVWRLQINFDGNDRHYDSAQSYGIV